MKFIFYDKIPIDSKGKFRRQRVIVEVTKKQIETLRTLNDVDSTFCQSVFAYAQFFGLPTKLMAQLLGIIDKKGRRLQK